MTDTTPTPSDPATEPPLLIVRDGQATPIDPAMTGEALLALRAWRRPMVLATPDDLDAAVEFDSPFTIRTDGTVLTVTHDVHAPEVGLDVDADGDILPGAEADMLAGLLAQGWAAVNGYSGQQGYAGPVMHASEYLGGALARDVLAAPGTYVVCAVDCYGDPDADPADFESAGWILLRRAATDQAAL